MQIAEKIVTKFGGEVAHFESTTRSGEQESYIFVPTDQVDALKAALREVRVFPPVLGLGRRIVPDEYTDEGDEYYDRFEYEGVNPAAAKYWRRILRRGQAVAIEPLGYRKAENDGLVVEAMARVGEKLIPVTATFDAQGTLIAFVRGAA